MQKSKKKRICLVLPSLHPGGMERVMSELAHYFASKPYIDLHLVLYGLKREVFYMLPQNITIHKPGFEFNNSQRFISSLKTLWFLRKKISGLYPDAILSFGEYWNSFVLLSLLGKKIPLFISDRCQPDKELGSIHDFLRRWLYPKAKGIIVQTEIAKLIYQKKNFNRNIKVINNPIRSIDNSKCTEKENIVISIGRLIKTKHHDALIKLFVKINRPGWKLIIVGDDALRQNNMKELQILIKDLEAEDKVILAGRQSDVESYYNKSKIFAFTSSSEGFPNVIGEALSAGLPVVAFDCVAGPAEMVKDGKNGYLIPLFDYDLFQQKLTHLMDDDILQMRMGKEAKKSVEKYDAINIGDSFENFIIDQSL